jgi:hypothetical protein
MSAKSCVDNNAPVASSLSQSGIGVRSSSPPLSMSLRAATASNAAFQSGSLARCRGRAPDTNTYRRRTCTSHRRLPSCPAPSRRGRSRSRRRRSSRVASHRRPEYRDGNHQRRGARSRRRGHGRRSAGAAIVEHEQHAREIVVAIRAQRVVDEHRRRRRAERGNRAVGGAIGIERHDGRRRGPRRVGRRLRRAVGKRLDELERDRISATTDVRSRPVADRIVTPVDVGGLVHAATANTIMTFIFMMTGSSRRRSSTGISIQ